MLLSAKVNGKVVNGSDGGSPFVGWQGPVNGWTLNTQYVYTHRPLAFCLTGGQLQHRLSADRLLFPLLHFGGTGRALTD